MNDAQTVGSPLRRAVPLSRVAGRTCARPGCPAPARATLSFSYGDRQAWLRPLSDVPVPEHYDLCGGHADRTAAPHGWVLVDERPHPDAGVPAPAEGVATADTRPPLAAADTVAVLAAALGRRAVDVVDPAVEDGLDDGSDVGHDPPLVEDEAASPPVANEAFDDLAELDGAGDADERDPPDVDVVPGIDDDARLFPLSTSEPRDRASSW